MTDEKDVLALINKAFDLTVNLRDERAGRV